MKKLTLPFGSFLDILIRKQESFHLFFVHMGLFAWKENMLIVKKVTWKGEANSKNLGLGGIIVIIEFCLILI